VRVTPAVVRQRLLDRAKVVLPRDARKSIVQSRLRAREATAKLRVLPDVLVIGAMRCGTSSLYKYLGYHPSVAPSLRKEVDYFTKHYAEGVDWYRAHFPLRMRKTLSDLRPQSNLIAFEASPSYLSDARAPARAAELLPDAKLIVLLRNPVDRAFSHWQHMVRLGFEELTFDEAVDAEDARLAPEFEKMQADPAYWSAAFNRYSYLARSRYGEQLERWLAHYPASQFLVVDSEALYTSPRETFADVLRFVDVPAWEPASFENYSYLGTAFDPSRSSISDATRARLDEYFAADQALLARLSIAR
jgi:hypothetical protein